MYTKANLRGLLLGTVLSLPAAALAVPITGTDVTISATAAWDSQFSSQTGIQSQTQAAWGIANGPSVSQGTAINSALTTGTATITGFLTGIGSQVGSSFFGLTGGDDGSFSSGSTLTLDMSNASATDTWAVALDLDFFGAASGFGGTSFSYVLHDFFADKAANDRYSFLYVENDPTFGPTEAGSTYTDTGNSLDNVVSDGQFQTGSNDWTDIGDEQILILLDPLQSLSISMFGDLEAGTFTDGDAAGSQLDQFMTIAGLTNLGAVAVPAPGALVLLLAGLLGLRLRLRR